ncbi:hypothetical protein K402DRAFT_406012 [Aulographum hederae CBS 113979]|uniref:HTH APSES-type domain-containing protein n=1 Tax=Aulographum hederae CBS 113979 TaxID=1176131 RepID=A0A6G1GTP2_9PEZI|nr:hypothetical protein K402DRAFT_406012 [Aulographum hederae CBS 113979]
MYLLILCSLSALPALPSTSTSTTSAPALNTTSPLHSPTSGSPSRLSLCSSRHRGVGVYGLPAFQQQRIDAVGSVRFRSTACPGPRGTANDSERATTLTTSRSISTDPQPSIQPSSIQLSAPSQARHRPVSSLSSAAISHQPSTTTAATCLEAPAVSSPAATVDSFDTRNSSKTRLQTPSIACLPTCALPPLEAACDRIPEQTSPLHLCRTSCPTEHFTSQTAAACTDPAPHSLVVNSRIQSAIQLSTRPPSHPREHHPPTTPPRLGLDPFPISTVKLALPSIHQVQPRGAADNHSWYQPHYAPRPSVSGERGPALPQIQPQAGSSSTSSSPRGGSFSTSSVLNGSVSSNTSYQSSVNDPHASGFKTPSPEQTPQSLGRDSHLNHQESPYGNQPPAYGYSNDSYSSMNSIQPYNDVHQSHMSSQAHVPSTAPPSALSHYSAYQPQVLQPGPHSYSSAPSSYAPYPYSNGMPPHGGHGVSSSMSNPLLAQSLPLPAMTAPGSGGLGGSQNYQPHSFDTTGQVAPPGMKPRVTATLWEDEGSLCFQVEAKGVCVARREDNHMINGTKLLNVAGMTRGRRDGILKSEKTRHVVKIGPMHLKGVWIPFDRALDFANKEKITESLYPLFVHDIGALLYHPTNQPRSAVSGAVSAVDRRRTDPRFLGTAPQTSQSPSLHHHHSLSGSSPHQSQPPHSIAPHPSAGRPGIDRAHTFPTPPTSASSIMGMGNSNSSYWENPSVNNIQPSQPLSIDTGLSNARSVPATPATTPPGNSIGSMQPYQTSQSYDTSRPPYTAPPTGQAQYPSLRYGQQSYVKTEMAPPGRAGENEQGPDMKPHETLSSQPGHAHGEEEAEHENDPEYTHTSSYSANRGSYNYNPPASASIHGEHAHLSPEITSSPHQNGSGRATPRTTATTSLYNIVNDSRSGANGNGAEGYQPGYSSQYPATNGGTPNNKRAREIDDEDDHYGRPSSRDAGEDGLKRRKTMEGGAVGGSPYANDDRSLHRTKAAISQRRR